MRLDIVCVIWFPDFVLVPNAVFWFPNSGNQKPVPCTPLGRHLGDAQLTTTNGGMLAVRSHHLQAAKRRLQAAKRALQAGERAPARQVDGQRPGPPSVA